MYIFTS